MNVEGISAKAFSVRVQGWGSPRQVAVHQGHIYFQAATCYPCPICDGRVASLEAGMTRSGHTSSQGYQYDKRQLDDLLFFVLPVPKEGVDVTKPKEVVTHLSKVFDVQMQAVTDQFGSPIALPMKRTVYEATTNEDDIRWDRTLGAESSVTIEGDKDKVVSWKTSETFVWMGVQSTGRLWKGSYSIDFVIEGFKPDQQMGVGYLLTPPDWGFFRYLGASGTAWSYDPGTGAIVNATEATHSGLPKIESDRGTITLELELPSDPSVEGTARFVVDGKPTPEIPVPGGAMVIPAACLHAHGQKVTLANFKFKPNAS